MDIHDNTTRLQITYNTITRRADDANTVILAQIKPLNLLQLSL